MARFCLPYFRHYTEWLAWRNNQGFQNSLFSYFAYTLNTGISHTLLKCIDHCWIQYMPNSVFVPNSACFAINLSSHPWVFVLQCSRFVCTSTLRDLSKCLRDKVSKYTSYKVAKYHFTFHNSNTDNIYTNMLSTVSNNNAQYRAPFPCPGNSVPPSDHWRHHIQVMSSNLAPGFDQRLIMVILTTLVKGDFASLASTNSLNQHCM